MGIGPLITNMRGDTPKDYLRRFLLNLTGDYFWTGWTLSLSSPPLQSFFSTKLCLCSFHIIIIIPSSNYFVFVSGPFVCSGFSFYPCFSFLVSVSIPVFLFFFMFFSVSVSFCFFFWFSFFLCFWVLFFYLFFSVCFFPCYCFCYFLVLDSVPALFPFPFLCIFFLFLFISFFSFFSDFPTWTKWGENRTKKR